jgi:cytochrome b involved in lipid metabolism
VTFSLSALLIFYPHHHHSWTIVVEDTKTNSPTVTPQRKETMSKTFSQADVASHNKADSLWIVVDGDVYDLTKFQDDHPGGKKILQRVAGKDASKQFWKYHNDGILRKYQKQLQIGSLDSKPKPAAEPTPVAVPAKKEVVKAKPTAAAPAEQSETLEPFGQQIPFADPSWYQSVSFAVS